MAHYTLRWTRYAGDEILVRSGLSPAQVVRCLSRACHNFRSITVLSIEEDWLERVNWKCTQEESPCGGRPGC